MNELIMAILGGLVGWYYFRTPVGILIGAVIGILLLWFLLLLIILGLIIIII